MGMPKKIKEEISEEIQVVVFKLGKEEFAIDINRVHEIIRMQDITAIPDTANNIEGVINLRGNIIVVLDLAGQMNAPHTDVSKYTRILVVSINENTVGMIIDIATEVLRVNNDQIKAPPQIQRIFGELLTPIRSLVTVLTDENGNLEDSRDLLLPRLISGELDVSDLDIDLGGNPP